MEQAIVLIGACLWAMNDQVIIPICYKVRKHPLLNFLALVWQSLDVPPVLHEVTIEAQTTIMTLSALRNKFYFTLVD